MAIVMGVIKEIVPAVYHAKVENGVLSAELKGVFVQKQRVEYDNETDEILSVSPAGQREADANELKEFFSAENADLITQAQAIKKDYEAKEQTRTAEIEQLKTENAELKATNAELIAIVEAL
jgi:hypothetical protein